MIYLALTKYKNMKSLKIIILILFALPIITKAQFVTIADTAFVNVLKQNFPTAMNGNQLDTTNVLFTTNNYFSCENENVKSFFGLQFMDSTQTVYIKGSKIENFNYFPPTLKSLSLDSCLYLDSIAFIPQGLTSLSIYSPQNLSYLATLPLSLESLNIIANIFMPTLNFSLPVLPPNLKTLVYHNFPLNTFPLLPANINFVEYNNCNLTTWPTVPNGVTTLNVPYNQITTMLPAPVTVTTINCRSNQISNLVLPSNIQSLDCSSNPLLAYPSLPQSLKIFIANNIFLLSLPSLPNSLEILFCNNSALNQLPTLPNTLLTLSCNANFLTNIPTLPSGLEQLYCGVNQIAVLPPLPSFLKILDFTSNPITQFPPLPASLEQLYCGNTSTSNIGTLPPSLFKLSCEKNFISNLPTIPQSLQYLNCSGNQLTTLPTLSITHLLNLNCANNQITCLPQLPKVLKELNIDNNFITCLPNSFVFEDPQIYLPYSTSGILSYPVCKPSSGCAFYHNLSGNIHQDTMGNCYLDSINPGNRLKNIKVQLLENGLVSQQMYVTDLGEYSFDTNPNDTFGVRVDTFGMPFQIACPTNFTHQEILTPLDSIHQNVNFAANTYGVDIEVKSIVGRFRPTFFSTVKINACDALVHHNLSLGQISGTVTTTFIGPVTYIGPAIGALTPTIVGTNSLTYNIADFSSLLPGSFDIILQTDTTAPIGSGVCVTTQVGNVANDYIPSNNSLTQCFGVVNSYDPNEKLVSPMFSAAGDWLTYTVHFQNTGNDTAFLVVIRDILSPNFSWESFTFLDASHKAIVQVNQNLVTFTFPNINLLDSVNHEPESHGWILFKVKLKSDLPIGTSTLNRASIYFDYNPPIITNNAISNVAPLSIGNPFAEKGNMQLFPNPAKNYTTLKHNVKGVSNLQIFGLDGQLIYQKDNISTTETLQLSAFSKGVYTAVIISEKGQKIMRKLSIE